MKNIKIGIVAMVFLITVGFTFSIFAGKVNAVPQLPHTFYGKVKINGVNVPDGTVVSGWIGQTQYATTSSLMYLGDSVYSFNMLGDDPDTTSIKEGGINGETVLFKIGSNLATSTAIFSSGTNAVMDLNVIISADTTPPAAPSGVVVI